MKRKIYAVIIALLAVTSITTITAFAKIIRTDWVEQKLDKGYSETDVYSIMAIIVLGDENVVTLIEQKYKELGDWKQVAMYYGLDLTEFHNFIEQQERVAKNLEIPDEIYEEMVAAGSARCRCR